MPGNARVGRRARDLARLRWYIGCSWAWDMKTISSTDLAAVAGGVKVKIQSGAWFNNLLVTAGNALSATAARQRAMQPKRSTNPFFEHGGVVGPLGSPTP